MSTSSTAWHPYWSGVFFHFLKWPIPPSNQPQPTPSNPKQHHTNPFFTNLVTPKAPTIGEKPVPVKGLERTGRDFDPEPLGERDRMQSWLNPTSRGKLSVIFDLSTTWLSDSKCGSYWMLEGDFFFKELTEVGWTGFKETNYESFATKSFLAAFTAGEWVGKSSFTCQGTSMWIRTGTSEEVSKTLMEGALRELCNSM